MRALGAYNNGSCSEKMVAESHHGLHASSARVIYKGSPDDRTIIGLKEGIAERTRLWNEDADVLHQPRWEEPERIAQSEVAKGQGIALAANEGRSRTRQGGIADGRESGIALQCGTSASTAPGETACVGAASE